MNAVNAIRRLESIRSDPILTQLEQHRPTLSIFRLLGRSRDERAHSRLIAGLFDPKQHANADPMLQGLGTQLKARLPVDVGNRVSELFADPTTVVAVHREKFRIDIILELTSDRENLVIGIENKVDASERNAQISDYQRILRSQYPRFTRIIVFLTISGHPPRTAGNDDDVPCVPLSYGEIAGLIDATRAVADESDAVVLSEISRHFREELMRDKEVIAMVRELWKEYPHAMRLATKHRPRLRDLQPTYKRALREKFGDDVIFSVYPRNKKMRELKMQLASWGDKYPFVFILYTSADPGPLNLRLLLRSTDHARAPEHFRSWAEFVNGSEPGLIDPEFRPIPKWKHWRRVLNEQAVPRSCELANQGFNQESVDEAVDRVIALVEKLHRFIVPVGDIRQEFDPSARV